MDLFKIGVSVEAQDRVSPLFALWSRGFQRSQAALEAFNGKFRDLERTQDAAARSFRVRSEMMERSLARQSRAMDARIAGARDNVATPFDVSGMTRLSQLEQDRAELERMNALRREQFEAAQIARNERLVAQHERLLRQQREMTALQEKADARASMMHGAVIGGGALALGGLAYGLLKSGAALEQTETGFNMRAGMNPAQTAAFEGAAMGVANQTMFSLKDVYAMAREMSSTGIGATRGGLHRWRPVQALLPIYAKVAEDIFRSSDEKVDPISTVHALSELSHQTGIYDAARMGPMADSLAKLSLMLPGQDLSPLVTAGGYVLPRAVRQLGIDPVQMLTVMAAGMATTGSGGSGIRGGFSGAAINSMLTRLVAPHGNRQIAALTAMGMLDRTGRANYLDASGRFQLNAFMGELTAFEASLKDPGGRAHAARLLGLGSGATATQIAASAYNSAAGGIAGGRAMTIFGDPAFQKLLERYRDTMTQLPDATQQQAIWMGTLSDQSSRLVSNFEMLVSVLGKSHGGVTNAVEMLGNAVFKVAQAAQAHPAIGTAAVGALGTGGLLGGVIGGGALLKGAFTMLGWEGAAALTGTATGLAAATAIAGAIAAVIEKGALMAHDTLVGGKVATPAKAYADALRQARERNELNYIRMGAGLSDDPYKSVSAKELTDYEHGMIHVSGDVVIHVDGGDPDKIIEQIKKQLSRAARSAGPTTGGTGGEAPGTHGMSH